MAKFADPQWPNAETFSEAAIAPEVREHNAAILDRLAKAPDIWKYELPLIRTARAAGRGSFPISPSDPRAEVHMVDGDGHSLPVRVLRPRTRAARGAYLHIHGGGWVMGTPSEMDHRMRQIAENTGLVTVSVDYRLAPEHPYPAAPDDCEAAALWLIASTAHDIPREFLAIGGESAGAHLSAVTLLRLRDRHGLWPFRAANLVAGCYDLGGTPSVRNWGKDKLILNTRDIFKFTENFLQGGEDTRSADVSPLYAALDRMPPALFSCGTKDLLIDDTMMMAQRWHAAGNGVELGIYPGGCHVFQGFDTALAEESLSQMDGFLNRMIEASAQA
jgi:acetyl esterase/lipase